jgi:branched-chain amino acid transport system substrate-binding protein
MNKGARVAALAAGALLLAACGGGGPSSGGGAVSDNKIVLGVITDMSGVYSQLAGKNSVAAVQMAVDDFKAAYGDTAVTKNISVISADHQNKPDVATTKAQEFYQRDGADVIIDVPTSSAALAIATVAKQSKKVFIDTGAATTALTNASCNKYTFAYAYDTYMLAQGTGRALTDQGIKNWYVVYPDYAFGQDMNKSFTAAITGAGGKVVRSDPAPFPNDNFSTFLTKAPSLSPKPNVIGVMQAGGDLVNFVKQYNQFGLKAQGIGLAVGLMFDTDITSIGQDTLAGTKYTTAWFWNLDDASKAWAEKFKAKTGVYPTFVQAADYSAATQYLEAAQRASSDNSEKVVAQLEGHSFSDFFAHNAQIRAKDHRNVHDAYLVLVKPKAASSVPGDYNALISTIPAAQAFAPESASTCSM